MRCRREVNRDSRAGPFRQWSAASTRGSHDLNEDAFLALEGISSRVRTDVPENSRPQRAFAKSTAAPNCLTHSPPLQSSPACVRARCPNCQTCQFTALTCRPPLSNMPVHHCVACRPPLLNIPVHHCLTCRPPLLNIPVHHCLTYRPPLLNIPVHHCLTYRCRKLVLVGTRRALGHRSTRRPRPLRPSQLAICP